jgi:hypothetical protein
MNHVHKLTAPVVIAVIGVLTLATGTAAASHMITGKDIKNHSVGYIDLSKSAVTKLHGAKGARGPKGAAGAPATLWYGGHISVLNTDGSSWATPTGFSTANSSSVNFVDAIGPSTPTTLVGLSVQVQNAPGAGSQRTFELVANDSESSPCIIVSTATSCTVTLSMPIPAGAILYVLSDVTGSTAQGADAAFAWTTKG